MPRLPFRLAQIGAVALLIAIPLACAAPASPAPTDPSTSSAPAASDAPTQAATANAVTINDFQFAPASLTVPKGAAVTWTNQEDSLHTVTAGTPETPSGLFDSGEIDTGVEFAFTFEAPGTYPFFCSRHDFMKGEITVTP